MNNFAAHFDIAEFNARLGEHIAESRRQRQAIMAEADAYIDAVENDKPVKPRRYSHREYVFHAGRDFLCMFASIKAAMLKAATPDNEPERLRDLNRVFEDLIDYHLPERLRTRRAAINARRAADSRNPVRQPDVERALYATTRDSTNKNPVREHAAEHPPFTPEQQAQIDHAVDCKNQVLQWRRDIHEWKLGGRKGPVPMFPTDVIVVGRSLLAETNDPDIRYLLADMERTARSYGAWPADFDAAQPAPRSPEVFASETG